MLELNAKDVGNPYPSESPSGLQNTRTYDYIIVGGGTAGCVLASRLSEDPSVTVLLIEQGPVEDTWASRVPLISANPFREGYLEIMRGEALGGTSRINSLFYTRGTPGDYNRWAELGNKGWGYDDIEPYFAKSEKTRDHPRSQYRGRNGPWENRQFSSFPYKFLPYVHKALERAGIERHQELNSPKMTAAGNGVHDILQDGKYQRQGVDRAFLPSSLVEERKARLKICTNTIVTKIHLADDDGHVRAKGVHFEASTTRKAGQKYYAAARREVILCTGALGSPQLLMLSGIGPAEHLSKKGVPVVCDVPAVGNYLQDHVGVPLTFEVPISDSLHELEVSPLKAVKELMKYIITGGGLLSLPTQESGTFLASRLLNENYAVSQASPQDLDTSLPSHRPDLEIMHIPLNSTDYDIPGKGIFSLLVAHITPKSYGSVRLATSNPRARPDVDLGFFSNPEDYLVVRKGIRFALRIAADIREAGYPINDLIVPAADSSDEVLDAFIRTNLRTCFHYTSTCRMGQDTHGERPSVVDTNLRVHGVRGLRVCDASVFPEIVGAHTVAPTVMVAEKCADIIKGGDAA